MHCKGHLPRQRQASACSVLHGGTAGCCSSARVQIGQGCIVDERRVSRRHACGVNITVANGCLSDLGCEVLRQPASPKRSGPSERARCALDNRDGKVRALSASGGSDTALVMSNLLAKQLASRAAFRAACCGPWCNLGRSGLAVAFR